MLDLFCRIIRKISMLFWSQWLRRNVFSGGQNAILFSPILITPQFLKLGKNVFIYNGARIEAFSSYAGRNYAPEIIISNDVRIQQNLHLTCAEYIFIGDGTAIAANVTITDIRHPYADISLSIESQPLDISPVNIGAGCKIYNNSVILAGTTIGRHCTIGANSVVSGTIPDYSVVAGNPARVIKMYNMHTGIWQKV